MNVCCWCGQQQAGQSCETPVWASQNWANPRQCFSFSDGDFILDWWRSKCGCRGGATALGKKKGGNTLNTTWQEAGSAITRGPDGWKKELIKPYRDPHTYSHVEGQLHLGMGQQLRGERRHLWGHQDSCRGRGRTGVGRVLTTHRQQQMQTQPQQAVTLLLKLLGCNIIVLSSAFC